MGMRHSGLWLAVGLLVTVCSAESFAGTNRWLLGTGVVFPSLNGSLTTNVAAVTWMRGRALGADYSFADTSAGSSSATLAGTSAVMSSDGWSGGLGYSQQLGTSANVSSVNAGLAVRLGRFGLGLMSNMLVSPSSGSPSFSYSAAYAGGGGFKYAAVLEPGLDTLTVGMGWVDSGVFGVEANYRTHTGALGEDRASAGVRLDGEYFGAALKAYTILSSPSGSTTGVLNYSGGIYLRAGSKYAFTAEKDSSVSTVGLNVAF